VTEQVLLGEVVRVHRAVQGSVELEGEEWAAQGRAQGQRENASVRNAARLYLMRLESLVTIGSAPNAAKR
jgi:hypothetical protein